MKSLDRRFEQMLFTAGGAIQIELDARFREAFRLCVEPAKHRSKIPSSLFAHSWRCRHYPINLCCLMMKVSSDVRTTLYLLHE